MPVSASCVNRDAVQVEPWGQPLEEVPDALLDGRILRSSRAPEQRAGRGSGRTQRGPQFLQLGFPPRIVGHGAPGTGQQQLS